MQKIRCCFVGIGGFSRPLDETSRKKYEALAEKLDCFYVGLAQGKRPVFFTEHAKFFLMPKLPSTILNYSSLLILGGPVLFWLVLTKRIRVIVAQSPYEGLVALIARQAARLLRRDVRLVIESHGNFEEDLFSQRRVWPEPLYRWIMNRISQSVIKRADALRAISSSTRTQLRKFNARAALLTFPTWSDMDAFVSAYQTRDLRSDLRVVLFVGVIIPRKKLNFLVEAFASVSRRHPDLQLWVVGDKVNGPYYQGLLKQVVELRLEKSVIFKPAVDQTALGDLMRQSAFLVLPSTSEGLGRVVFEAMAAGLPVIGSNVGGIPDMIREGETGFLVNPGDIKTLGSRIAWLVENPEVARRMGICAHEWAATFFSSGHYVANYVQLSESALGLRAAEN